jgi:hypothetical protein
MDNPPFIHDKALVESDDIGSGTRIWAFARVMAGDRAAGSRSSCAARH